LNGPTGRLPALPSESLTWLFVVRPADEERFITTLRASTDSVVVWNPEAAGETSVPERFPRLAETIRTLYEPSARFGPIAVWRRRVGTSSAAKGPGQSDPPESIHGRQDRPVVVTRRSISGGAPTMVSSGSAPSPAAHSSGS
jgi:hypothetical protein